jgi:hypothetical protein
MRNQMIFITSHWVIPKLSTDFETLKKVFEQEKFKKYTNVVDCMNHIIVDSAPYKNSWFRLPYETTEENKKRFIKLNKEVLRITSFMIFQKMLNHSHMIV